MRLLTFPLIFFLSACAAKSSEIQVNYVSPHIYDSLTCEMLEQEYFRLAAKSQLVFRQQDEIAADDEVAVGVGIAMFLFFPATLVSVGNNEVAAQVAQLKGELVAIEQTAILKNCMDLKSQIASDRDAASQ